MPGQMSSQCSGACASGSFCKAGSVKKDQVGKRVAPVASQSARICPWPQRRSLCVLGAGGVLYDFHDAAVASGFRAPYGLSMVRQPTNGLRTLFPWRVMTMPSDEHD